MLSTIIGALYRAVIFLPSVLVILRWVKVVHLFAESTVSAGVRIVQDEHPGCRRADWQGTRLRSRDLKFIDPVCSHMAIAFENDHLYAIAISDELTHLYSLRHFRYCIEREMSHFEQYGAGSLFC